MPKCYCGKEALYHHDNSVIYGGRVYGDRGVYYCPDYNKGCDGWVGTHPNGEPLGRLKDKTGRELAKKAHSLFDPLWRGTNKRRAMYQWLQKQMNLTEEECHFALMTDDQLIQAITILERKTKTMNNQQTTVQDYINALNKLPADAVMHLCGDTDYYLYQCGNNCVLNTQELYDEPQYKLVSTNTDTPLH